MKQHLTTLTLTLYQNLSSRPPPGLPKSQGEPHPESLFTFLAAAVHPVAALVPIRPDAVVHVGLEIARHLGELEGDAHLRILRVKGHGGNVGRARRADALGEAAQAILAAGPLADGEVAGAGKGRRAADVVAVGRVVEPLALVCARRQVAVRVADVDLVRGVDCLSGGALFVGAELELAVSLDHAVRGGVVDVVVVEAESVAVFRREDVAFA